ncbi:MAG: hypothetical protein JO165_02475, partial [Candidatus Eremiobacteraeota bacterium]|nr:hypothetical protein [Candidatus Eremiobacteraeota bacterium]
RELGVLRELPRLRSLRVRAMPHLNVRDFRVLADCTALRALSVDLGSRKKNREIYRIARSSIA